MTQLATQQLEAIHSMLSAGHRNLRVERHSLILWGATCGGLIMISDRILTPEQFPDSGQRALAWLILLALTVAGISLLDWHLTRRAKQARDEAWSFIHRQVLKVWWLLMSVGVMLTFATFFYGGGHMIMAAWVVLTGLGLYVHGLFSEEFLEWVGAILIAIGIAMLAFRLSYATSQWIAGAALGLGLSLLAAMLDRGRQRPAWVRLVQSVGWLLCVLIPPLVAQQLARTSVQPEAPVVSLQEFLSQPASRQVVALPAGSNVPMKIELSGNVFRASQELVLPLVLNEPIEVAVSNGQLTGEWRMPGENWKQARETHAVSIPSLEATLSPRVGPEIHASLVVDTRHEPIR